MTALEALRAKLTTYPIGTDLLCTALIDRGLDGGMAYTSEMGASRAFKGAWADCLRAVALAWNVSEGGVSLTLSDRSHIVRLANMLYRDLGEPLFEGGTPKVEIL